MLFIAAKDKIVMLYINIIKQDICWKLCKADLINERFKWMERHTMFMDWMTQNITMLVLPWIDI